MKKKAVIIISITMVLAGIAVIMYPVINKANTKKKQDEMIKSIKEDIIKNANKNTNNNITAKPDEKILSKVDSVAKLELEEDNTNSSNKSTKTKFDNEEVMGIIEIKKIDIMFAIVEGAQRAHLSYSICHIPKTASIGQSGNCVLAGHRGGIYGEFFKHLDRLSNSDEVVLTDLNGNEYTYKVYESKVINPTDTYVTESIDGKDTLTMLTCESNGKKRLMVRAELIK